MSESNPPEADPSFDLGPNSSSLKYMVRARARHGDIYRVYERRTKSYTYVAHDPQAIKLRTLNPLLMQVAGR
jgi:hypothetical protein